MHTSSHCDTVSVDAIVPIGIRLNVLKFSLILKRIPRVCIKTWKTILPRIDKQDFRSPHSHQYSLLDMDSLKQLTIICVIVNQKVIDKNSSKVPCIHPVSSRMHSLMQVTSLSQLRMQSNWVCSHILMHSSSKSGTLISIMSLIHLTKFPIEFEKLTYGHSKNVSKTVFGSTSSQQTRVVTKLNLTNIILVNIIYKLRQIVLYQLKIV